MAKLGSGFDIVSGGELSRVLKAGGDPAKVVFSGVAKTEQEIALALEHNIKCFNVESLPELDRINKVAGQLGKRAPISLRVNPDVDAKTHPYILILINMPRPLLNVCKGANPYNLFLNLVALLWLTQGYY